MAQDLKSILIKHGFPRFNAQIWSEFVSNALALYWQAVDILIEPTRWAEFEQKQGAIGAPRKKGMNKGVQFPNEDAITSEIGFIVKELREKLPIGHILRKYEAQFSFESQVSCETKSGRYLSKVDHFVKSALRNGPELAIEAKPLTARSDVAARYLADDGIGCFFRADSNYSIGPLGAMWAYTMEPNTDSFRMDIRDGLKAYKHNASCVDQIGGIYLTSPGKEIDCSCHDRSFVALKPITLLHLESKFPCKSGGLLRSSANHSEPG